MAGIGLITPPEKTGQPVGLSADAYPEWMDIGATIAWALVPAATAARTLEDGTPVGIGEKVIEVGSVMAKITVGEVNTITINATGGTFTITVLDDGVSRTTTALAWNASAAEVRAALEAIVGVGRAAVALAGQVYTLTFNPVLGNIVVTTTAALTGGTTNTAVVAVTTQGSDEAGKYAPFDSTQTDGRQTLLRGDVGLMPQTIKMQVAGIYNLPLNTELTGLIIGGLVFRLRLKVDGTNQPTMANLLAALPRLELTRAQ